MVLQHNDTTYNISSLSLILYTMFFFFIVLFLHKENSNFRIHMWAFPHHISLRYLRCLLGRCFDKSLFLMLYISQVRLPKCRNATDPVTPPTLLIHYPQIFPFPNTPRVHECDALVFPHGLWRDCWTFMVIIPHACETSFSFL